MKKKWRVCGSVWIAIATLTAFGLCLEDAVRAQEPNPGYLYVLDSARSARTSQVLAIDLATNKVVRTFRAGNMPDEVVSPDGSRLYISSSTWDDNAHLWKSSLDTYDTSSGALIAQADNPDDLIYTAAQYPTRMKMSPSGKWIFILKNHQTITNDEYYMAIFDTALNGFLPYRASLPGCRTAVFSPADENPDVDIACIDNQNVIRVAMDPRGTSAVESRVFLRASGEPFINVGAVIPASTGGLPRFITRDGNGLLVTRSAGSIRKINRGSSPERWVRMQEALIDKNATALCFATGTLSSHKNGSDAFDQIVKADLTTLVPQATLETALPFYSMTLNPVTSTIYTVSPYLGMITAVDAANLKETVQIRSVGEWPVFALSAPAPQP